MKSVRLKMSNGENIILFLAAAKSIHTVRWVNELAKRGYIVHLVYNADHQPSINNINERVQLHKLKYGGSVAYYFNAVELKHLFKTIQPAIVHVMYGSGYGTLARMAHITVDVLTCIGSDIYEFPNRSKLTYQILKKNMKNSRYITTMSSYMAKIVKSMISIPDEKNVILPFGIEFNKFHPKSDLSFGDEIIIGNIKSLYPVYGIEYLIKAIRLLIDDLSANKDTIKIASSIRLQIYGDGPDKDKYLNLINALNLNKIVTLKGRIQQQYVPEVLSKFNVFCSPSNSEGLGVSALEAMATKVPIVVSDADGFMEITEHGKYGVIVCKKNPLSIKDGLKKLILDKKLYVTLAENSYLHVKNKFDWENCADILENVYQKIKS